MKKLHITSQIVVKVETIVNPSEDPKKVIAAINNIIDGGQLEIIYDNNKIVGTSIGILPLRTIYEQVRSRSTISVLRRILLGNYIGKTTWFLLNKQAAAAGIVVVIDEPRESSLGPIEITIDCKEMDVLINWLVPLV
jgi:uncharacterized protein